MSRTGTAVGNSFLILSNRHCFFFFSDGFRKKSEFFRIFQFQFPAKVSLHWIFLTPQSHTGAPSHRETHTKTYEKHRNVIATWFPGASWVAQLVKNPFAMQETLV